MATKNITQLRRLVFRIWDSSANTWSVFTLEPDDLGQDTVMTFNIAPRLKERSTQMGTSNSPIYGTFEDLSASVTFLADDWYTIGKALNKWTSATYTGANSKAGNILGDSTSLCADTEYMSVVAQGYCDDGSTADIEFTRCQPSLDSDIELGTGSSVEVELALHPQIYNETLHSSDGYPAYTYRMGDYDTGTNYRLNASTGDYTEVTG